MEDEEEQEERTAAAAAVWEDMYGDCLARVFALLPLDDVAAAAPLVCRSWRRASLDPALWRAIDLRGGHTGRFMPWGPLGEAFARRYGVRRFAFSGFLRLCVARAQGSAVELALPALLGSPASELDYISIECPMLRKLVLPSMASGDEARLPEIVKRWRCLEHLEIEYKPKSFIEMAAKIGANCPNFVGLKMVGSIKGEDAFAIVNVLAKLKFLCLDKSYLPKQELLVIINGCNDLEELSVKNCIGFDEHDEEVTMKGAKIKRFEVEGSRLVREFDHRMDDELCGSSYVDVI